LSGENLWKVEGGRSGDRLGSTLSGYFCSVTTLVGAQRELLNMKLQTIHQLLQDCKPDKGVEVPEPGRAGSGVW
jgi:hypothetical protein